MILHGNALEVLATLEANSLHSCVTSPPYWGLRDYSTSPVQWPEVMFMPMSGLPAMTIPAQACELGQEADPWAFVGHIVAIFREVRRVVRQDGTLLLNIGDSYVSSSKTAEYAPNGSTVKQGAKLEQLRARSRPARGGDLPQKNLLGIPWRVAFALQADGWVLRQDIIWQKPNPMPESVQDRCTKAHEYIFLLSKSPRYYWDKDAISEPLAGSSVLRLSQNLEGQAGSGRVPGKTNGTMKAVSAHSPRNTFKRADSKRSAPILGQAYGTHRPDRAASPAAVVEDFIKAIDRGSSFTVGKTAEHQQGRAGQGPRRVQLGRALELAEQHGLTEAHLNALRAVGLSGETARGDLQTGTGKNDPEVQRLADEARAVLGSYAREFLIGTTRNRRTVWSIPTTPFKEAHYAVMAPALARDLILVSTPPGGMVLDPFLGSGTTQREALKVGRECLGIELHPENIRLAERLAKGTQPGLALIGIGAD